MSLTPVRQQRNLLNRRTTKEELMAKLSNIEDEPRRQRPRLQITENERKRLNSKKNLDAVTSPLQEDLNTYKENIVLKDKLNKCQKILLRVAELTQNDDSELAESLNALLKDANLNYTQQTLEDEVETNCSDLSFIQVPKSTDSFLNHLLKNPSKLNFYMQQLTSEITEREERVKLLESQLEDAEILVEKLKVSNKSMIDEMNKGKNHKRTLRKIKRLSERSDNVEETDVLRDVILKFTDLIRNCTAINTELVESLIDSGNLGLFKEESNKNLLKAIVQLFKFHC